MVGHIPPDPTPAFADMLHATTVAVDGKGILIVGPSGAGKSALALQLIAMGAVLVADDRTMLTLREGHAIASCPLAIQSQIEARGIGILKLNTCPEVPLHMVVDMGTLETERLPKAHDFEVFGVHLPCFHRVEGPHLASTLMLLAQGAYLNPDDPI